MTWQRLLLAAMVHCLAVQALIAQAAEPSERFRQLDRNSDGKLLKEELPGGVQAFFDRIDKNGDGSISPDEERATPQRPGAGPPSVAVPSTVEAQLDLSYAGTENARQKLDLYLPKTRKSEKPLPVVVFIHGGGWQNGDKRGGYRIVAPLVESGEYAGASIGYRLTNEAIWPEQIYDCKAAIRWLKGNAKKHNLDPEKIGVTGTSAGGHLVAVLGTSGGVAELEGKLGEFTSENSRVACVVDQFGPTHFLELLEAGGNASGPVGKLIGGKPDGAKSASATTYVTKDDPPFLFLHGTEDKVVPLKQSELLHEELKKAGVASTLVLVEGAGHGQFRSRAPAERMKQFFDKHLLGKDVTVSSEAIKTDTK